MARLLERNHISLPEGGRKADSGSKTNDHERYERCHALKVGVSQS